MEWYRISQALFMGTFLSEPWFFLAFVNTVNSRYLDVGYLELPLISKKKIWSLL